MGDQNQEHKKRSDKINEQVAKDELGNQEQIDEQDERKAQEKRDRKERQEKEFLTRWTSSLMRTHKRIKHETQILGKITDPIIFKGHFLFVIYASLNQVKSERYKGSK